MTWVRVRPDGGIPGSYSQERGERPYKRWGQGRRTQPRRGRGRQTQHACSKSSSTSPIYDDFGGFRSVDFKAQNGLKTGKNAQNNAPHALNGVNRLRRLFVNFCNGSAFEFPPGRNRAGLTVSRHRVDAPAHAAEPGYVQHGRGFAGWNYTEGMIAVENPAVFVARIPLDYIRFRAIDRLPGQSGLAVRAFGRLRLLRSGEERRSGAAAEAGLKFVPPIGLGCGAGTEAGHITLAVDHNDGRIGEDSEPAPGVVVL